MPNGVGVLPGVIGSPNPGHGIPSSYGCFLIVGHAHVVNTLPWASGASWLARHDGGSSSESAHRREDRAASGVNPASSSMVVLAPESGSVR